MPKISVIVAVYNVEQYLRRSLDCLVKQTLKDLEFICVDDCSTDNSLVILQEYAQKDSRFKIISSEVNGGAAIARNKGLEVATGDYLGFIDPDDTIDLNFYEELYKKAIETNCDIVKCPRKNIDINGNESIGSAQNKIKKDGIYAFYFEWTTAIYRASIIFDNNIRFNDKLIKGQDVVFLNEIILKSEKLELIDNVFYYYYKRIGSMHSKELSFNKFISAVNAISQIMDNINKSDLYEKNKNGYNMIYKYRYAPYVSFFYKTEDEKAKKIWANAVIQSWNDCKDRTNLEKTFRYKMLIPSLKKGDTKKLLKIMNKYNSSKSLKKAECKKTFIKNIFSIRNKKKHKVITILGFKINLKLEWNTTKYHKNKIDLVYLWVDGNDPEHKKSREFWQKELGVPISESNNDHRYVDHEELRYSLRSAMKNAPWIRKIFIVTNGQIPKWLDLSKTDKIEIITHEQIMPKDALPTFNSRAIEFCLANIPDLSEHFLLANDDCFFNRPVTADFFFEKDGKPIVRLRKAKLTKYKLEDIYCYSIKYTNDLINLKQDKKSSLIPHHNIDAYSKSLYTECIETYQEEFKKMIYSKFRTEGIQRVIFALYLLKKGKGKLKYINRTKFYKHQDSLCIKISSGYSMLKRITLNTPFLLCLNDTSLVNNKDLDDCKTFFEYLFPEKQIFENDDAILGVKPEILNTYKNYESKFNIFWKIRNKIKYFVMVPLIHMFNFIFKVKTEKNH